jgi:acetylornithine deacetylase
MGADRALAALTRLVAHPTVAGQPNGRLVADIADRLEHAGAVVSVLPGTRPDAANLHAVLGPADAADGLLLAAHTDVVAVDGQPWTHDPFALHVENGRAYGRGTADMKGFLAAVLAALDATDARRLRRPLHLALSSDEELGCAGVGPLLDTLAALPVRPARALVGEPTELRVVNRHKGKAAVRVHLRGRAAHSSLAPTGVNAVAYAGRLINGLLDLQQKLAAGHSDAAYQVPHATIGIGPIEGGVSVNIVPDYCRLDIEVRTLPDQEPEALVARIRDLCGSLEREMRAVDTATSISIETLSSYPGLRPTDDRSFAATVAALTAEAAHGAVDFGTEAGLYQRRLSIPVLVCGPGSMAQAHRADEFVALDQLARAEVMVRGLVEDLCQDERPARPVSAR